LQYIVLWVGFLDVKAVYLFWLSISRRGGRRVVMNEAVGQPCPEIYQSHDEVQRLETDALLLKIGPRLYSGIFIEAYTSSNSEDKKRDIEEKQEKDSAFPLCHCRPLRRQESVFHLSNANVRIRAWDVRSKLFVWCAEALT
jgi:hypothetical protein